MNEDEIMEGNKLRKRGSFLSTLFKAGILSGIMFLVMGLTATAFADQTISVSCYKEPKSESPLGSAVVYNVADAAQACNSLYYDCKGRCVGCYQDFDYVDNVCVDIRGNVFLK